MLGITQLLYEVYPPAFNRGRIVCEIVGDSLNGSRNMIKQPADSIFTAPESPWDHVFSDLDLDPAPAPPVLRHRPRLQDFTKGRKKGHGSNQSHLQRSSSVRQQRASLTARETSVFNDMFDLIFNAVSASSSGSGSRSTSAPAPVPSSSTPSFSGQTPSIGRAGAPLNDIFRTLRRHTSRVRWTTAIDEELDRKKETMELFDTDHDLLQWVTKELFGESQQWDEEAKQAIAASSTEHPINHSIYPHLIAHAMRIFRTTYSNPSLSLAIFNHAAHASIPSYVFGCTAPAYNELIEAKWEGWGDLEGVCNALEEMRTNGIKIDGRTRIVVERVRREVGGARLVELEGPDAEIDEPGDDAMVNPLARRVWRELGEVEVMRLVGRIEQLALRERSRKSKVTPHEESWKSAALQSSEDDGWSFDSWDKKSVGNTKKQASNVSETSSRPWS
ncbi:hypothetical protein JVU11DRAFT_2198, partial [Chiua virens]